MSLSQKGRRKKEGLDGGFSESGSDFKLSLEHPDGALAHPASTTHSPALLNISLSHKIEAYCHLQDTSVPCFYGHFLMPVPSQGNSTVTGTDFRILIPVQKAKDLPVAIDVKIVIPMLKMGVAASVWLVVFSAGVVVVNGTTPSSVVVAIIVGSGLHPIHSPTRSHLTGLLIPPSTTLHYTTSALKHASFVVVTPINFLELRFSFRRLTPPDGIRLLII
ncbi:hypothetical protein EV421DRAFT_1735934 [Armillaria borealis]|uniref:Uncharacterized protein n=1 Tax=Armillaria borealis TaxID=47425 RepID=A0AA39JHF9_9AGAR|nr:hypothetical protein EV421DRAFT_1735934 [Armillaria borealis]